MKKKNSILCLFVLFSNFCFGQNLNQLNQEEIRKMEGHKTGVYVPKGVFYKGGEKLSSSIQSIRQSGDALKSTERVVIDFSTPNTPKIYSYLSDSEKILYIDFFNTEIKDKKLELTNSMFVDSINFYPWKKDGSLSMEIKLKERVFCDLFYLESPGRMVIDIRKGL